MNDTGIFFYSLEENLDTVFALSNNVIIMGDLNCNMLTENPLSKRVNKNM